MVPDPDLSTKIIIFKVAAHAMQTVIFYNILYANLHIN